MNLKDHGFKIENKIVVDYPDYLKYDSLWYKIWETKNYTGSFGIHRQLFRYYNNDIGDYIEFLYEVDDESIIEIRTSTNSIDGDIFKFYNKTEYIKERLLEIESEKSDLEKELKELELPKVGKIYDIVVDGNMNKNVYVDEIENDYIRFKYIINRSIGNGSIKMNRIKQFIHKPEYDEMAKQICAFIELGKED